MGLSLFDGPTPIESFVFSQVLSGLNLKHHRYSHHTAY
jgi:hypothetical protein